ncbi:hypothetical protein Agabi119p4_7436 [Agaricus bisporus var. burnettii]|uniref:Protein kinase domain-containing protein n=1 Tax=Agaricus bisporus var. burnettii TaxID=192524 RepID=A0A8H7C829_AGABI|nr:hypothetical protein Agabi119p4_7436 [Agaricus bisporus var. burnettii]
MTGYDSGDEEPPIPQTVQNWWLNEKLGSGYSGSIYRATNIYTKQIVALKLQWVEHACPTNRYERCLYPLIQGGKGIPKLWAAGVQGSWDFLAIDLLGQSLDNIYRKNGKEVMNLGSVCCIAMQVIQRLEFMHTRGVLHRDIQLGNCVLGLPPHDKVIYMIDFGFSKRYIDPYTNRHIPNSNAKRDFIGNYWFSSVNVHCRGKVPSRRDDLEAVALMLIHLMTPRGLSWTRNGVPKTSQAHDLLIREKRNALPEDLCKGLPTVFEEFLRYTRRLKFDQCPNYQVWIDKFKKLAVDEGYSSSDNFIWPPPSPTVGHKTANTPRRLLSPPVKKDDMVGILGGIAKLDLGGRPVLVNNARINKTTIQETQEAKSSKLDVRDGVETSDANALPGLPPRLALQKGQQLERLSKSVGPATTNKELSKYVSDFIQIMQSNSGRTLTRPAFQFLDVLYTQLDKSSLVIRPTTMSKTKSFNEPVPEKEKQASHVKLGVVARLRREVHSARSSKELATMVADFARVTNRSTGRTVSKDGFAFLEGIAERLKVLK